MLTGAIIRAFKESRVFRIIVIGALFLYMLNQMGFSIYSRYYEKVEITSFSSINSMELISMEPGYQKGLIQKSGERFSNNNRK